MAETDSDMEAVINALGAVKLYRNFYASSVDFAENLERICVALEANIKPPHLLLRVHIAEALRKTYGIHRPNPTDAENAEAASLNSSL